MATLVLEVSMLNSDYYSSFKVISGLIDRTIPMTEQFFRFKNRLSQSFCKFVFSLFSKLKTTKMEEAGLY
jgi:hypothetical protein